MRSAQVFFTLSSLLLLTSACSGSSDESVADTGSGTLPGDETGIDASGDDATAEDSGMPTDDSSTPESDTGGTPSDTGTAPGDSGTKPSDTGTKPTDTGPVDAGTPLTPGDPGTVDVTFTIRSDTDVHAISPLVYGTNGTRDIGANHQTIVRSGGNRLTAYNWENNASNAGSDWCFQNDGLMSSSDTPGAGIQPMVTLAKSSGAAALVTIPIVDYVAADKTGGSDPPACSGDVRKSGSSYLSTRFKKNLSTKPTALSATPDKTDDSVYQDEFVSWLGSAVPGANVVYALDNEPDLWSDTHAEVHPTKVGYDELCNRDLDFAKAIKRVTPTAKVTGFVSYGFNGYVNLQSAPDAAGKGDFTEYWLDKMKAGETAAGKRLVDYLDLHWYSEAQGGGTRITGSDTSAAVVAARVQAPRSLWDPTYSETSWIKDYLGGPIKLIPRYLGKIAAHYPGTQLAISEWNYGGGTHISGALASADVLGIFGREGVGIATLWELNGDEHFTYAAFKAYRNFDGAGAAFGDTSISAKTSDVATATVYASVDAAKPTRVVIIAINKATTAKTAGITVAHPTSFKTAKVYTVTSASATPAAAPAISVVATNAFRYSMPAQSISVIVPAP
ncbi:MAG: glycoside hydrolase family 44 protein [Polyangiales bacterium]